MSNTVIQVDRLSKVYRLGQIGTGTVTNDLKVWWARARGKPNPLAKVGEEDQGDHDGEELWALRDVSFTMEQGEALGIIGPNGAGKSTLLKILSQVTSPTSGVVKVKGRIASLLEVGTGFHPELTGRENIYLNGAIMGMSRAEVTRKFDEIVDFSGVEQFIDTPVKRYSSGMYVRLAFAVAAHLDPEILVVDEVLAVGDAQFQKKCLGKMGEVAHEGRTVLFVSHNMQAIRRLCETCILLDQGTVEMMMPTDQVIQRYLKSNVQVESMDEMVSFLAKIPADPVFRFKSINLRQDGQKVFSQIENNWPLEIEIGYQVLQPTSGLRVFFDLCDSEGELLFRSFNDEQSNGIPFVKNGEYISKASIPANLLSPVDYELVIYSTIYNERYCAPYDGIHIPISVERTGKVNSAYLNEPIRGKLAPVIPWTTKRQNRDD